MLDFDRVVSLTTYICVDNCVERLKGITACCDEQWRHNILPKISNIDMVLPLLSGENYQKNNKARIKNKDFPHKMIAAKLANLRIMVIFHAVLPLIKQPTLFQSQNKNRKRDTRRNFECFSELPCINLLTPNCLRLCRGIN